MFGECNAILDNEFGSGVAINLPRLNKEKDRAAKMTLPCDIVASRTSFQTVGKYFTVDLLLHCLFHVTTQSNLECFSLWM